VIAGGNSLLTHCTVEDNRTAAWHASGGAIRADSGCAIRSCIIRRNSMWSGDQNNGYAISANSGVTVANSLIAQNVNSPGGNGGQAGGAIYLFDSALLSSTVTSNTDYRVASGVYGDWATIKNCIVSGNGGGGANVYVWNAASISNSCAPELVVDGTNGNVTASPLFQNAAEGNFRLRRDSPCLNAGTNEAWMATASDLDGKPRLQQRVVDMGCYEGAPSGGTSFVVR